MPIIARAHNRTHVHRLADMGITRYYRETWYASLEMALQSLLQLQMPLSEATTDIAQFRDHDLALLKRQRAIYTDENKLIQSTREASEELATLFEADREDAREADKK